MNCCPEVQSTDTRPAHSLPCLIGLIRARTETSTVLRFSGAAPSGSPVAGSASAYIDKVKLIIKNINQVKCIIIEARIFSRVKSENINLQKTEERSSKSFVLSLLSSLLS